jgi:hypothetical protein
LSHYDTRQRGFCLLSNLLRCSQSFEADFIPLALALLGDQKYFHGYMAWDMRQT